ncbi:DUF3883 domain-containing protein [Tamlana sp. 62-3]|uniref:DUF3883 domain-containing protein n=1 Tax=Neotamlana sargassicola TaxID=2883125 RepID=A0A9X1L4U1_9FLAO|nr:DUF3883 domain-containing protein [Tamlana sargassicola]MCB4808475.1 DUF3883 domain-containing protein [Tamlana sargassicola]
MIDNLRQEFIQEALAAPKLFKDLAKVEQYIAESYKTRALIELIQNADDAGASKFGIHSFSNGFVVGNNGKPFTISDVEALCRSGSSNKYRGGETIGYRGIGFKSVVNIANVVNIISGDFKFSFDRKKTIKALGRDIDVPLIRIPHTFNEEDIKLENEVKEIISKFNYKTAFVFGNVIEAISKDELNELDKSSLLFLNNLNEVHVNYRDIQRNIFVKHNFDKNNNTVQLIENESIEEWLIEQLENNNIDLVAFKIENNSIIPASNEQSVMHSFTPTKEFVGAFIKINGDYTTDPSRKTVDMDDLSKKSFNNAVNIIVNNIKEIFRGDMSKQGFFTPFINIQTTESTRFKNLLFKSLEVKITTFIDNLRIKPEWINFEDYELICSNEINSISRNLISAYPEIFTFFKALNTKTLNINDILKHLNNVNLSVIGYAEIFSKIIVQWRYDLDLNKINQLKTIRIFPSDKGILNAEQLNNSNELDNDFINYLNNNIDVADLLLFFKKLGIEVNQNIERKTNEIFELNKTAKESPLKNTQSTFKVPPAIKKWRSSEKNALEYLKALNVALSVKDVTEANLGYDLEIMLHNGKRIYIEVKSVNTFTEPFKISNNEYSSAHNYGSDYFIALVVNNDDFKIRFLQNPIKSLNFEKKCERWSWFCGEYIDELQQVNQIIQ